MNNPFAHQKNTTQKIAKGAKTFGTAVAVVATASFVTEMAVKGVAAIRNKIRRNAKAEPAPTQES
jgi:hypothetical protein